MHRKKRPRKAKNSSSFLEDNDTSTEQPDELEFPSFPEMKKSLVEEITKGIKNDLKSDFKVMIAA